MAMDAGIIELVISSDNLRVWARVNPQGDPDSTSEQGVVSALTAQSIIIDDAVQERVRALIEQIRSGDYPTKDALIAEGLAPVAGQDGTVEWADSCDPDRATEPDDAVAVDYYAQSSIISVSEGDVICTVRPPTEGTPGRDVYGREVAAKRGRRVPIQFGDTIVREGDSGIMQTQISGRLNVVGNHVWVSPLLVINRNVDFQSGSIDFDGSVQVRGNVLDLFQVKCTKDLVVNGLIEAAKIEVGGDLIVGGGVAGKEKAVLTAGGKVRARFLDNCTVNAGGDIFIQREAVNARLATRGRLVTPGTITACTIVAPGGVEAAIVGSQSGIRTSLVVGYDAETQREMSRVDRELEALIGNTRAQRAQLDAMLQRQAGMTEMQRARLAKMLMQIKEQMAAADELHKQRAALEEVVKATRGASIRVSRMIREGTTVQVGRAVTTLRMGLKGPLELVCHKVDGTDRVAATSGEGKLVVLEAVEV